MLATDFVNISTVLLLNKFSQNGWLWIMFSLFKLNFPAMFKNVVSVVRSSSEK